MEVTYELMYELMGPNEVTLKNPNMNDWFEMIWNDDMKWYELRTKFGTWRKNITIGDRFCLQWRHLGQGIVWGIVLGWAPRITNTGITVRADTHRMKWYDMIQWYCVYIWYMKCLPIPFACWLHPQSSTVILGSGVSVSGVSVVL